MANTTVNINPLEILEPLLSATFMNSVYLKQLQQDNINKTQQELLQEVVNEWATASTVVKHAVQLTKG